MVERRLITLLLSGLFLMSVLPFSPSVSFDPLQMGDDDEGGAISEVQISALQSLPDSVKVSGRTDNSTESWEWAVKAGDEWNDYGRGIAVDSSGNAFVIGSFDKTATFGSFSLVSNGRDDIFIAKLNSSGSWQWAVKAGGSNIDYGWGIAVDSSGNAFVTGLFTETASFGSTSLVSSGSFEIFVAKLNSSGSWQWAVKAGGNYWDSGRGIAVDSGGNIYVTGYFNRTASFGSTSITSSGGYEIFIAKLNSSGSWQWAVKAGGSDDDFSWGIAVDSSGNAYVTGSFEETAIFGNISLVSSGSIATFIAKISSSGSWQWVVKAGGNSQGASWGSGIAVDSNDNAYVTGGFTEIATFGNTSLTSSGEGDIFVAKMNSSGSWQWAVKAGGPDSQFGAGIAVDSNDNAFVTGSFEQTANFGITSLVSSGDSDIFVAKLSSSGSWNWAVKAGGPKFNTNIDAGWGIAFDSNDNVYVTGAFSETATFGSTSLRSSGRMDIFIAKLGPDHDMDGITDLLDQCPNGMTDWVSNTSTDNDRDGCRDSDEDLDDDNDGITDSNDSCAKGDFGWTSNSSTDYDGDGCQDAVEDMDDDNDGITDSNDSCAKGDLGWISSSPTDYDGDGCQDAVEDMDDDNDGITDSNDSCAKGDLGWISSSATDYDGDGCQDDYEDLDDDNDGHQDREDAFSTDASEWRDSDGDGVGDNSDAFPNHPKEWSDSDGDGVGDNSDAFPTDSSEWRDSDGDSVGDNSDAFPYDPEEWSDSDLDEVGDNSDAFPTDPHEWNDRDNDLIGDNSDACPDIFGTSLHPLPGCPDSDSDGWADSDDVFPNDDSEWSDSDADGVGDNSDSCPLEFGTSSKNDTYGCPVNDEIDANETIDSDGDGVKDNSDNCPGTTNNTVVDLEGCVITTKSTSKTSSNFLSHSGTWTAIIALFVAIIVVVVKVRSGGGGKDEEEEGVAQQVFAQTNLTMSSFSKPSAQVIANNGIDNGYELLNYEGNKYYRIPGSWSEWTQYQR